MLNIQFYFNINWNTVESKNLQLSIRFKQKEKYEVVHI